jgi:hypothetical protein
MTPLNKVLRSARSTAIDEAASAKTRQDYQDKVSWESRRAFLDQLSAEFASLGEDASDKVVFVSYSVTSGTERFTRIEPLLKERGFEVTTGFRPHTGDNDNVLKRVQSQLKRSTVYFGLLTKELEVRVPNSSEWRFSPSVWTMEEKGMALALQKPFVLLVEAGIHEDFWKKTAPERVHHIFTAETFMEQAKAAADAAEERFLEWKLRQTAS